MSTTLLTGTVDAATRLSGINYYGIGELNVVLGSGNDIVNVQGTSTLNQPSTARRKVLENPTRNARTAARSRGRVRLRALAIELN